MSLTYYISLPIFQNPARAINVSRLELIKYRHGWFTGLLMNLSTKQTPYLTVNYSGLQHTVYIGFYISGAGAYTHEPKFSS